MDKEVTGTTRDNLSSNPSLRSMCGSWIPSKSCCSITVVLGSTRHKFTKDRGDYILAFEAFPTAVQAGMTTFNMILKSHIGKTIQFTTLTGQVIQGTLEEVTGNLAVIQNETTNYVLLDNIAWVSLL